jgi:hypothetical protein
MATMKLIRTTTAAAHRSRPWLALRAVIVCVLDRDAGRRSIDQAAGRFGPRLEAPCARPVDPA